MHVWKTAASVASGLAIWGAVFQGPPYYQAIGMKLKGEANDCPWMKVLTLPRDAMRFSQIREQLAPRFAIERSDASLGIDLVRSPGRSFWIKKQGGEMDGKGLLTYLFSEQEWIAESAPGQGVRKGDVVVDCGAHVGVFTDVALRAGAAKVVMIEPDPVNVECLRRNFQAEIASGRAVLVPEGAWSSVSKIDLHIGVANSGTGSMMYKEEGGTTVSVPVRPIDDMLRTLGIDRVDFIKMDIEGAEREALKGSSNALRRDKPRLMLDSYHLPDDGAVLPSIIRGANAGYELVCGPCELNENHGSRIAPHVAFYR